MVQRLLIWIRRGEERGKDEEGRVDGCEEITNEKGR